MSEFTIISFIILPPLLIAIVVIPVASLFRMSKPERLGSLSFCASLISFVFSLVLLRAFPHTVSRFTFFGIQFSIDALSVYFIVLTNVVALFASFFTRFTVMQGGEIEESYDGGRASSPRFHLQFNLLYCSMLLLPMMDNLFVLCILIAFMTAVSAMLIGYRPDREAREAAWKYGMISLPAILIALLGTIFLITAFSENAAIALNWSSLTDALTKHHLVPGPQAQSIIKLAFLLILIGYGTMAGLFPMHTWLPDSLGEAPSPVSALISGVLLKSALYIILRFYVISNLALAGPGETMHDNFPSYALLIFGLLSLIMATLFILNIKKGSRFKRVLAFLNLEHMGMITFALGLSIPLAFFGSLFNMMNHALSMSLMFLTYGHIQSANPKVPIGGEIHGVLHNMPFAGSILGLGGLALVGAPPFSVSLSEFMILWAAFRKALGNPLGIVILCLFLISVTLTFAGIVAHLGRVLLGKSPVQPEKKFGYKKQYFVLGVMLLLLIWGGFNSFPFTALLGQNVRILCQGVCP